MLAEIQLKLSVLLLWYSKGRILWDLADHAPCLERLGAAGLDSILSFSSFAILRRCVCADVTTGASGAGHPFSQMLGSISAPFEALRRLNEWNVPVFYHLPISSSIRKLL
jgi:hypothetical protein